MGYQEQPFSPDFPPETENTQPKTHTFSNGVGSSFYNDQNHSHATQMENFKALFLRYALSSSPTKSLSPMQRSIIEQRLHDFFPDFHTPDHPAYAAMIETAIKKLNKEGGSTEEAISQFIRNEYPDLPQAHDSLFKHHLGNLCKDGAVVNAGNRFYMIGDEHSPDSLCNLSHVVTHSPTSSPTSNIGAESSPRLSPSSSPSWNSSPSWCSCTSCSSFPSPKRKRPYARRQKRGRKRGRQHKRTTKRKRVHLKSRGKRVKKRGRPRKNNVVEEEDRVDSDKLMLEEEVEESEEQNGRKEEHNEVVDGHDQVRKKSVKRRGRPRKKNALEEEDRVDSNKLMLEEEVEESEEQNGRKEEHNEVVDGHDQVRRKRRKIKELVQRQETRTLIETDLDLSEGMIKEEWRGKQSQEELVSGDNNQAEVLEKQKQDQAHDIEGKEEEDWPLQNHTEVIFKCKLQQEVEVEVVGHEDHLKDGLREVTAQEDTAEADHQVIEEGIFLKDTKFEVNGEQSLLEEHDIEIVKGATKEQKKKAQPCKGIVRGRKLHQKRATVYGRCRGRPHKEDLLVEESQPNAVEATKIQEVMLEEKTEVTKEQNEVNKEGAVGIEGKNQVNKNGQETFECSQAEETETEIEIGKPAVIAEENESEEQHNRVMEGESQLIGGAERCDEQQEHENIIDQDCYQSRKDKNEVSKEQNKPHRQQNEEQNQPIKKNVEYNTEQEVEMDEMHNQNPKIQQKIWLGGERDVVERMIASKGTILATESSGPVYEAEEEKVSKKDMERQKKSPGEEENNKLCGEHTHRSPDFSTSELSSKLESVEISSPLQFLQLPGPMYEEEKEKKSKKNMEQHGESPGQEGNIEIADKPEFSSSESSSKSKSEEVSFQQESLQQPPQAEEKPQQLWHRFLKKFSLYGGL